MLTKNQEPSVIPRPGYLDMKNPIDGFDWELFELGLHRINSELVSAATFLVLFTSEQLNDLSNEDKELLRTLDSASHDEASQSNALIKYFAGEVDTHGRAMSWCLWTDRREAANALHGPNHKSAIRLAKEGRFYKTYMVRFYSVTHSIETGFVFTPIATGHNLELNQQENHYANI